MKKLIFILMVGGLFAQDNQQLSDTEKIIYFESQQKNPLMAVSLELLIPSGGYHYLDRVGIFNLPFSFIRWGSGVTSLILFKLGNEKIEDEKSDRLICEIDALDSTSECSNYYISSYDGSENIVGGYVFAGIYGFLTLCQMHDIIAGTEEYNYKLYKKIFGKNPPSFSLNLQPTYQGANLTMSYAFD